MIPDKSNEKQKHDPENLNGSVTSTESIRWGHLDAILDGKKSGRLKQWKKRRIVKFRKIRGRDRIFLLGIG